MKPFQYKIDRRARSTTFEKVAGRQPMPPEEVGLILGKTPRSIPEWRVAVALQQLKIRFQYQVVLFGGTDVRGGLVLDFLVLDPFPIPLFVHGQYWHESELSPVERFNINKVENYYGTKAVILWDWELQDQDAANEAVERKVKR